MDTRDNGHDVSGIVLAGGLSSRMGAVKALLPFGGVPLITRIVGTLRPLCGELIVVASTNRCTCSVLPNAIFEKS